MGEERECPAHGTLCDGAHCAEREAAGPCYTTAGEAWEAAASAMRSDGAPYLDEEAVREALRGLERGLLRAASSLHSPDLIIEDDDGDPG